MSENPMFKMPLTTRFQLLFVVCLFAVVNVMADSGGRVSLTPDIASLIKQEKYAEAAVLVGQMTNADPRLVAWLDLKQGKTEQATNLLQNVIQNAGQSNLNAIVDSIYILKDSSTKGAIQLARKYLNTDQYRDEPRLKIVLAKVYLKDGNGHDASTLLDEVCKTSYEGSDLKDALSRLILYYFDTGQAGQSLAYYEKLYAKSPETLLDPGYQMQWCNIANTAGRQMEAVAKMDELQTQFPDYYAKNEIGFHFERGLAYEGLGYKERAIKEWIIVTNLGQGSGSGLVKGAVDKLKFYQDFDGGLAKAKEAAIAKQSNTITSTPREIFIAFFVVFSLAMVVLFFWLKKRA